MRSAFSTGLVGNKLIGWGVLLEFVLIGLVDYTSWGNRLFATAPITTSVWLFILPFCLGLFVLEDLRKRLIRGRGYSG
jgi:sodium/potassium-transporting ATPase subunit alpha